MDQNIVSEKKWLAALEHRKKKAVEEENQRKEEHSRFSVVPGICYLLPAFQNRSNALYKLRKTLKKPKKRPRKRFHDFMMLLDEIERKEKRAKFEKSQKIGEEKERVKLKILHEKRVRLAKLH